MIVKHFGFDINEKRVAELQAGKDGTLEVTEDALQNVLKASQNGPGWSTLFNAATCL